jgi:trans-aconitate methyltransferase
MNIEYAGVDINPDLIETAKKVYQKARFVVLDLEEEDIEGSFDWVFESGIFNFKLSDNNSFIQNVLKKMFKICNKEIAVDFMSDYLDFKNEDAYYASPEEIFRFCKTLSRRVTLRHDYMPFEFCVYIYKDDRINERIVFEEFVQGG